MSERLTIPPEDIKSAFMAHGVRVVVLKPFEERQGLQEPAPCASEAPAHEFTINITGSEQQCVDACRSDMSLWDALTVHVELAHKDTLWLRRIVADIALGGDYDDKSLALLDRVHAALTDAPRRCDKERFKGLLEVSHIDDDYVAYGHVAPEGPCLLSKAGRYMGDIARLARESETEVMDEK